MAAIETLSRHRCHGGAVGFYRHQAATAALVGAWDKALADPEFGAKMAALGPIRKVLSDSLYRELTL